MRTSGIMTAGAAGIALLALASPASALSMQECSDKFKAAQKSGAAANMNWAQFRSAECAAGSTMKMSTTKPGDTAKEAKKAAKSKAAPDKGKEAKAGSGVSKHADKRPKNAETDKAAKKAAAEKLKASKNVKADAAGPSMAECSARYRAAKQAGSLGELSWNAFRAGGCMAETKHSPAQKQAADKTSKPVDMQKRPAKAATADSKAAAAGASVKVSEQECSARYQAAKTADALGGMTWNSFRSSGCPTIATGRAGSMVPTAAGMFPTSIPRKYAHLPVGRARMLTCRDQYVANKAAGMDESKWSLSGGGFYSECNRRLGNH